MKAFKTFFFARLFPLIPKRLMTRVVGHIMRIPIPRVLRAPVLSAFAGFFSIDVKAAELPLTSYGSMDALFTRKLRADLRPIQANFVHPVDGELTEFGVITEGQAVQAKGWTYPVHEFLGDQALAKAYEGGMFLTYYLCPTDYHRIHSPLKGDLLSSQHIPGMLWPVNEWSVHNIRRLFSLNERVVLNFQSPEGKWSLVMVAATNVGHITVSVDPTIVTNHWTWGESSKRAYSPPLTIATGQELGIFHLGSTVICLFEKSFQFKNLTSGPTKLGEPIR